MIIIVEGPDGLGKTTLVAELGQRLNCPTFAPYEKEGLKLTRDYIKGHDAGTVGMSARLADKVDIVFDRSFPSEVAYSHAFERSYDRSLYVDLDAKAAAVPHVGFCILPPKGDETMWWHIARSRGVDDVPERQWRRVAHGYWEYLMWSRMEWRILDPAAPIERSIERAMTFVVAHRDSTNSKHRVFLEMARNAARRSTCLSRRTGAVLVSCSGHVIAVGYNGAPRGFPHPTECPRLCLTSGRDLDQCNDSHAEENCIVHAALSGANPSGGTIYTVNSPCVRCARMLINAGVVEVVYEREYDLRAIAMMKEAHMDVVQL